MKEHATIGASRRGGPAGALKGCRTEPYRLVLLLKGVEAAFFFKAVLARAVEELIVMNGLPM